MEILPGDRCPRRLVEVISAKSFGGAVEPDLELAMVDTDSGYGSEA
jgi:hypothetical protein